LNQLAHNITAQSHAVSWPFPRSDSNGKEKDYESGFHYYGARYYWSELLTGWLSVDPMSDKYPNISPYNYCSWNPVKYIDPDGEEKLIWFSSTRPQRMRGESMQKYQKRLDDFRKNQKLQRYASRFSDKTDIIHVFAHGDNIEGVTTGQLFFNGKHQTAFGFLSDELVDSKTFTNSNKENPCVIMLHCCYTGQGERSFAQELSSTGALVIAPSDKCRIYVNKDNGEFVGNGGTWNVFLDGKRICQLKGDVKNTKKLLAQLKKSPTEVYQYYYKKYVKNAE
jgi:RHS repeat-associated protein